MTAHNCRGQTAAGPPCGGCPRCLDEQYESSRVAIAVDIEGELAMLEKALIDAERALLGAEVLEQERRDAEETEHERHDGWLGRSSRHKKLSYAVDELRRGVELLGRAMRAPTTIDDEIPF